MFTLVSRREREIRPNFFDGNFELLQRVNQIVDHLLLLGCKWNNRTAEEEEEEESKVKEEEERGGWKGSGRKGRRRKKSEEVI